MMGGRSRAALVKVIIRYQFSCPIHPFAIRTASLKDISTAEAGLQACPSAHLSLYHTRSAVRLLPSFYGDSKSRSCTLFPPSPKASSLSLPLSLHCPVYARTHSVLSGESEKLLRNYHGDILYVR